MTDTVTVFPRSAPLPSQPVRETGVALRATEPSRFYYRSGSSTATSPAVYPIDKLYPAIEGTGTEVLTALGLLADAIDTMERARTAAHAQDILTADRHAQRFQAALPSLFAVRTIGDGYALIINSLHFALINQRGVPLNLTQLTTVWRVLRELRNAPFLQFEQSLDHVADLEDCGLAVDPPIISQLIEEDE